MGTNPSVGIRAAACGFAVAVASGIAAKRGVSPTERDGFLAINGLPDQISIALWAPMQAGALGAPLGLAAFTWATGSRRRAATIAVSGTAAWLAAKGVKRAVARQRPSSDLPQTALRLGSADHGLGFPSGHAAVATVVGMSLIPSAGRSAAVAVPAVVGFSRVHVGAHYPLDIIGGWGLGLAMWGVVEVVGDLLSRRS